MRYRQLFIGILITLAGLSNTKAEMEQDYRIVKDGEQFTVLGIADSKSYFKSEQANKAIQFAIDKLGDDGGQVVISRGNFPLDEPLNLKDRIHLLGSGRATRLMVSKSNSSVVVGNSSLP